MKVGVAQFQIVPGEVEQNYKKGENFIKQAKEEGCDLILLPEVWTTGFLFKKLKELSKTTTDILKEIRKLSEGIMICGTYVVDNPDSDKVFNIFYAILNGEILFSYKKTMLFGLTGEDRFFDRGDIEQTNTFEALDTTFGVTVCYELRFPELFRKASFNGAKVHLHPAIWPQTRLEHWTTLTRARAIENQFFLLTTNGVGTSGKWELCGHSTIYNPWGEILVNLKHREGLEFAHINLEDVEKTREQLTSLKDSIKFLKDIYSLK